MDQITKPQNPIYYGHVRSEIFGLMPKPPGKVLDVGGGIGATALALKQNGLAARVGVIDLVEPSRFLPELDFAVSGDLDRTETIEELGSRYGPFDTVLCLDVLEHLKDPWSLIATLDRYLAPGGCIIASIPNARNYRLVLPLLFKGKFELTDSGIMDRTHLRWFVRSTAIDLMTSSGLTLEEVVDQVYDSRKTHLFNLLTFRLFHRFTELQYLVKVRKDKAGAPRPS